MAKFYNALLVLLEDRPSGHWIPVREAHPLYMEYDDPDALGYAQCSNCNILTNCGGTKNGLPFCPICGANMREEQNEAN